MDKENKEYEMQEHGYPEEPVLDIDMGELENQNNDIDGYIESNEDGFTVDSARLKYQEICDNISHEEKRIYELEERRKRLVNDMERLQKEIEYEKLLFREAIDIEIGKKHTTDRNDELIPVKNTQPIDPFSIDRDQVRCQLKEYRDSLEQSKDETNSRQDDTEIQRFKSNLVQYKKGLVQSETSKISREKRKSAAKVFQKHLKQIESKCIDEIDKLDNIQKNIEHFNCTPSEQEKN